MPQRTSDEIDGAATLPRRARSRTARLRHPGTADLDAAIRRTAVHGCAARLGIEMFDALSDRLRQALSGLTGHGRISEADVDVAMREIRLALLEADVNYRVVKDFVARVKE